MKRYIAPLVWLLALLLPLAASAQDERPVRGQEHPVPLDSIVVIGMAYHHSATMSRLSVDQLKRIRAEVAYDALEYEPGLHLIERTGLTGTGLARLAIRGAGTEGPAGLAVFIDGRPDPTVSFAHPIPQSHHIGDIREIVVIHGPSPVLHGAGNTGAMMIRTREPGPGFSGELTASGGSHATLENYASAAYAGEQGFLQGHISYRRTDGYLPNTDAWIVGGNLRAAYQLSDNWRVRLAAGQTHDHFGIFGPFFVPGPFGNPGTTQLDLTHTTGDLQLQGDLGRVNTTVQVWGQDLNPRSQVLPEGAERADVWDLGSRLRAEIAPSTSSQLTLGADVLHSSARNQPAVPPDAPDIDVELTEVGPYAFYEQVLSPQFSVSGGVRLTSHSEYGFEPSGEAGLLFQPGAATRSNFLRGMLFRARLTRGFQSPTLQQLFGVFRGGLVGPSNPDLEPERVTQLEGGVEQRLSWMSFRLTGFVQDGSNIIAPLTGELQNTGDFRHYGLEASLAVRLLPSLTIDGGLTTLNLSDNILRAPRNTVDFGLSFEPGEPGDATFRVYGRYANEIYDQPLEPEGSPIMRLDDYMVLNAMLRVRVWRETSAFAEVQNITDAEYEDVIGIPQPPRSVFGGLTVGW